MDGWIILCFGLPSLANDSSTRVKFLSAFAHNCFGYFTEVFHPLYSCVAGRCQHPDSMLFHLARGYCVVELPPVRLGRVRPRAIWTVLHHRLERLSYLSQRRLLRHLLLHLFHASSCPPHHGVPVSDHLQSVTLLLPPVFKRNSQQPALHWETTVHGEQSVKSFFFVICCMCTLQCLRKTFEITKGWFILPHHYAVPPEAVADLLKFCSGVHAVQFAAETTGVVFSG